MNEEAQQPAKRPKWKNHNKQSAKRAALRKLFKRGAVVGDIDAPRFGL